MTCREVQRARVCVVLCVDCGSEEANVLVVVQNWLEADGSLVSRLGKGREDICQSGLHEHSGKESEGVHRGGWFWNESDVLTERVKRMFLSTAGKRCFGRRCRGNSVEEKTEKQRGETGLSASQSSVLLSDAPAVT